MPQSFDTLRFEIFDPVSAREPWAVQYASPGEHAVRILVNGRDLNALLTELEDREDGLDAPCPDEGGGRYGHVGLWLHRELTERYRDALGAPVCCCAECGEVGCDGVCVHVRADDREVVWHHFEHEHCGYAYGGLTFRFERGAYDAQIRQLKVWAEEYGR